MRPITIARSRVRFVSRFSCGLLCATLPAVPAFSQSAAPKASTAPAPSKPAPSVAPSTAKPITPLNNSAFAGEFPLEAGDVLSVVVANHPELSGTLPVTEAGKISLPIVGNLKVSGKTIAQAEKLIFKAMDTQINNPQVTVTLVRNRPRQILVVGAVRGAGAQNLNPNWRISEAIDAAGGLAGEPDDLIATLARGKAQPIPIDLAQIVASPRDASNLILKPGDILRFNLRPGRTVAVSGDVKSAGTFILRRGTNLLDALDAAGGFTSQKRENSKVTLVRGGRETVVDALVARSSPENIALQNGDLLKVEAVRTQVSLVAFRNEVRNSGPVSIEGEARVFEAVLAAGLAVAPEQVNVSIQRGTEKIPIDFQRAAYDPTANVPLENGDLLLFMPPSGPAVRVAGGVSRPGLFNLKPDATLLDAIFASGGLAGKPEDINLSILRQSGERQSKLSVNPVSLISLQDLSQNVRLKEGDLVMVNPVQTNTVFIAGEVGAPAPYQMRENEGLAEVLLRAGGPTPFAALKRVQITHSDNTSVSVDLSRALEAGAERVSVPLQPGDLIRVPKNLNQVLIMNAVQKPGYYAIPENEPLTIGKALLLAMPTGGAKLQNVALVRMDANGQMGKPQIVPVNSLKNNAATGGMLPMNVVLQPGDIIYVPERITKASALQTAISGLSGLTLLRQVFPY